MKQFIRIFISLVLVLALTLSFAACTAEETRDSEETDESKTVETEEKKEDSIVGSWKTTIDMTEAVNEAISGEDEDVAKYIQIKEFTATVTYVLNEDGTYEIKVDKEAAEKTAKKMMEDITEGMKKLLEDTLASANIEMTLDEYLQTLGTSLEEVVDEAYGETDFTEIFDGFNDKGIYKLEGNKLFSAEKDASFTETEYEIFELNGDKLTLKELVGAPEEETEMAKLIYPLEFDRIK